MIRYEIAVLESMIEHYTKNIEMFQSLVPSDAVIKSIGDMVANRRLVASFIENDGMPTVPVGWRNGDVFFDGMVNAACSGVEIY
jgi:hypothetical protein